MWILKKKPWTRNLKCLDLKNYSSIKNWTYFYNAYPHIFKQFDME